MAKEAKEERLIKKKMYKGKNKVIKCKKIELIFKIKKLKLFKKVI